VTIAKIAYLTSPGEGRFTLNFQPFGETETTSIEIGPDQMKNILVDGVTLMLRQSFIRVPVNPTKEGAQ
jgi:hypothetical protein